jgi:hypothetical protein
VEHGGDEVAAKQSSGRSWRVKTRTAEGGNRTGKGGE